MNPGNRIKRFIEKLPIPGQLKHLLLIPPGHFYSPIPSLKEIKQYENTIFAAPPKFLPGIDLNTEEQLYLFDQLKIFYPTVPFSEHASPAMRYRYDNETYSYSDAITLFCMMRYLRPKNIIEIGSGYSSCVILDTNELFFNDNIQCTFIEPYPELLHSLITQNDIRRHTIIDKKLQDIDIEQFSLLRENDILFLDSTHVAKIHSDVNYFFFQLLPHLQSGVYIHIHDIMYPFEYPREWIYGGKAWNEAYMLRTFLQYNTSFTIVYFNTYLQHFFGEKFRSEMPLCLKNRGGSIWLKKV
jgi:hypothetical protein